MILPAVFLDMLSLTDTIATPLRYEKGLRQFGIVWTHILQYQKSGLRQVLLIPLYVLWDVIYHLYNVVNHGKYHFAWWVVDNGHPEVFVYFTPCDGHFCNISIIRYPMEYPNVLTSWEVASNAAFYHSCLFFWPTIRL